jgi:hypothetical protein
VSDGTIRASTLLAHGLAFAVAVGRWWSCLWPYVEDAKLCEVYVGGGSEPVDNGVDARRARFPIGLDRCVCADDMVELRGGEAALKSCQVK